MTEKRALLHLFRGAPCVRSWSTYQTTVEEWTLCGVHRSIHARSQLDKLAQSVEDPSLVSCPQCLQLMRPSFKSASQGAFR
jgi:hypothetical protein